MEEILNQLGGLVLGSVPTIVFFLLLVAAYGVLVRRPLDRVLEERRLRTSGALEKARGAIEAAEAETAVFEDKLRAAKADIFAERDRKLKQWGSEREQALAQARETMQGKIRDARQRIDESTAEAQREIEGRSAELSEQILRAVLPAGATRPEARP